MKSELASQLVGTWKLVSYSAVTPDGATTYPFGMYAQGRLIYDARGRMAVQIGQPGQSPFASGDPRRPSGAEAQSAYNRYLAYYGTFTVDAGRRTITHHLEVSLSPDWANSDQVRHFTLEGDYLTLVTPPTLFDSVLRVTTLVWERLPDR